MKSSQNKALELLDFIDYRLFLKTYYEQKKSRSPKWSYKAWARQLGVKSSSTLIMIVNGERNPGPKLTQLLCLFFNFDKERSNYFTSLIRLQRARLEQTSGDDILAKLQLTKTVDEGSGSAVSSKDQIGDLFLSMHSTDLTAAREHLATYLQSFRKQFHQPDGLPYAIKVILVPLHKSAAKRTRCEDP